MDTDPTGPNCPPYRDWKIAEEHQRPELWCPLRIVISSPWIDRSISEFQISQRKLECHGEWWAKLGSTCT